MLVVAQVVSQLGIQRTLGSSLVSCLRMPFGTDQVFRFLVVGQELIQQLVGDGMFRLAHGVSGAERQWSLMSRLHKNSDTFVQDSVKLNVVSPITESLITVGCGPKRSGRSRQAAPEQDVMYPLHKIRLPLTRLCYQDALVGGRSRQQGFEVFDAIGQRQAFEM